MSDSHAILRHLEERHPDPPLFPRDPARRAELDVFMEWFNRVWKPAPNRIEAEGDPGGELAETMRGHLGLFPFRKYARSRDPADDERFHVVLAEHQSVEGRPRLAAWIERVDALPRAYG